MYYFSLFLLFLLVTQFKIFIKIRYYLSWWAYSFPIAAITIASILMYERTGFIFFKFLSLTLIITLSLVIITLIAKTVEAMVDGTICVKED
jgi:tellurite resistance protein